MESLQGRVYAVTGGSRGMGLQYARALTREGAHVCVLARPSEALEAVARDLPEALCLPCDVGVLADVRRAFAAIGARHGKLHGLINNAASCLPHTMGEATDAEIDSQVSTNFLGPIWTVREAFPLMKAAGRGDIVNVSSESTRIPFPMLALYAATKAGIENLDVGLRSEMRPHNIRVTTFRVGQVGGSSLGTHWDPEKAKVFAEVCAKIPGLNASSPMTPDTTANLMIQLLKLPAEANVDIVEMRAF